jgi:hypothetical protein
MQPHYQVTKTDRLQHIFSFSIYWFRNDNSWAAGLRYNPETIWLYDLDKFTIDSSIRFVHQLTMDVQQVPFDQLNKSTRSVHEADCFSIWNILSFINWLMVFWDHKSSTVFDSFCTWNVANVPNRQRVAATATLWYAAPFGERDTGWRVKDFCEKQMDYISANMV